MNNMKIMCCPIDYSLRTNNNELFFSLVDYRNNLFTSNNPDKIIEFYYSFDNREQLIEWMKERPKGSHKIQEVEGDKDIIVVIPTADFNEKYAKECRDNIFKGLHIIFVESGVGNYYFNFAHNVNAGIRRAMEYNPKWIIVSNDDMVCADKVDALINILLKIDNNKIDSVFAIPTTQHSSIAIVGRKRPIIGSILLLSYNIYKYKSLKRYRFHNQNKWLLAYGNKLISKLLLYKSIKYPVTMDFGIFSSKFLKENLQSENNIFDETYINSYEDHDISIRLFMNGAKYKYIDYNIQGVGGGTFNYENSDARSLRAIASSIYFSDRIDKILGNK